MTKMDVEGILTNEESWIIGKKWGKMISRNPQSESINTR